jgi:putative endonuclease
MPARFTRAIVQTLDRLAGRTLPSEATPEHQRTGRRGEEDACFYHRKLGYVIVARNFRSPRRKGEIDLIGWDGEILCFIEVKTRSSHEIKPAEAAVDQAKRQELAAVAGQYLRRMPPSCQWRFDVLTVYHENHQTCQPEIELFKNAFAVVK